MQASLVVEVLAGTAGKGEHGPLDVTFVLP